MKLPRPDLPSVLRAVTIGLCAAVVGFNIHQLAYQPHTRATVLIGSIALLVLGVLVGFNLGQVFMLRVNRRIRDDVYRFDVHFEEGPDGVTGIITHDGLPVHTFHLPEGYDPAEDNGALIRQRLAEWSAGRGD